jgi:hypothetical protein
MVSVDAIKLGAGMTANELLIVEYVVCWISSQFAFVSRDTKETNMEINELISILGTQEMLPDIEVMATPTKLINAFARRLRIVAFAPSSSLIWIILVIGPSEPHEHDIH